MRRKLGLLAGTTWILVASAVVTAAPAEARRNVGGTLPEGNACVYPGGAQFQDPALTALPCVCVSVAGAGTFRNVGNDPTAECPAGQTRTRIDRNVGG